MKPCFAVSQSLITGLVTAVVASQMASAATINVDFNTTAPTPTYSGTAAAPDGGTTWNGLATGPKGGPLVASITSGALLSSTGGATAITVTLGNFQAYDAASDGQPASFASELMSDFVYQQILGPGGPNSTLSINNLNPAFTYDLYLYAQNGGYNNTATTFTINGVTLIANNDLGPASSFVENTNYVRFTGVAPNGSGMISGTFNDFEPANNAAFNGLQIVEIIPEPASAALAGAAGLLALRRRRPRAS